MTKSVQLAIRMTEELRDRIKAAAEAEHRSMSSYMELAIYKALEESAAGKQSKKK